MSYTDGVLVTATEYGVSKTTGSGIDGVLLDVYRSVPCEKTPEHPYTTRVEYAVKAMRFDTREEANAYALAHGWLKVRRSK